jgi:arylsulfatase A-like enzyme
MQLMASTDLHLYNFLQRMKSSGHLDNTMLVLVGDHGAILSPYYTTPIGSLEYKLPLSNVMLPKWFMDKHQDVAGKQK